MQNILMLILILIIYLQASNEDDDKAEIFASMANAAEVISLSSEETCKPQEKKFIRDEEKLWWSHWYLNLNDKLELVGKHLSLSFKKAAKAANKYGFLSYWATTQTCNNLVPMCSRVHIFNSGWSLWRVHISPRKSICFAQNM